MRKEIEWAGFKWVLTDETPSKKEQKEFIAETNRLLDGFLKDKRLLK